MYSVLPKTTCGKCGTSLSDQNVARKHDQKIRLDAQRRAWCNPCTQEHDGIDFDAFSEGTC